jgi:hypothetical protein
VTPVTMGPYASSLEASHYFNSIASVSVPEIQYLDITADGLKKERYPPGSTLL